MAVQWATMSPDKPDPPHIVQWSKDKTLSDAKNATADAIAFTADEGRVWYNHVSAAMCLHCMQAGD